MIYKMDKEKTNTSFIEWMEKAKQDLNASKDSLKSNNLGWATFQIQQSAEKALKSVLIKKESRLVKNHDLVYLGNMLNLPKNYLDHCKEISQFYVVNRYPDIPEINLTKERVEEYLSWTKEVLEWCEKQI